MALDKILIRGGNVLRGELTVGGAKNAALPVLATTLLTEEKCTIHRVPELNDMDAMKAILRALGTTIESTDPRTLHFDGSGVDQFEAPYDYVRKMRASVLVLGPLLARFGKAKVSLPGGCAIGVRPINLHLKAFEALGAHIEIHNGYVEATAKKLTGNRHYFDSITVTGTINAIVAASLAKGESVFENCALEPEVTQICEMLQSMGIPIEGAGTHTIMVQGREKAKGCELSLIGDRIEAGTYMVAAAMTAGDVTIRGVDAKHVGATLNKIQETGSTVTVTKDGIRVKGIDTVSPTHITTAPFPAFATDMQAQFMSLLAIAKGTSVVTETIFENRFMHVPELARMGAKMEINGSSVTITGVPRLTGAPVMATDLRASASLVLAGLVAEGVTEVLRIYHLDRGYEKMEEKLRNVGASIERVPEDSKKTEGP